MAEDSNHVRSALLRHGGCEALGYFAELLASCSYGVPVRELNAGNVREELDVADFSVVMVAR